MFTDYKSLRDAVEDCTCVGIKHYYYFLYPIDIRSPDARSVATSVQQSCDCKAIFMSEERKLRDSKLVRIDSKDRDIGSQSQYNFKVSTNDFQLHNVKRVLLKSVLFPNTQYNVTPFNNMLIYDLGAVTVPKGQYSLIELLDELIVQFAAEGPAVVMTYVINTITNKITFTFGGALILTGASPMSKLIGLDPQVDTASLTVHIMPNTFNVSGLQKVYIGSHTMTRGTTMTSSDKSHIKVFTEIPIRVNYGSVEHRTLNDLHSIDESTHSIPFNLSQIDITLYDQDLNVIDLNGLDTQIVLKVFMS